MSTPIKTKTVEEVVLDYFDNPFGFEYLEPEPLEKSDMEIALRLRSMFSEMGLYSGCDVDDEKYSQLVLNLQLGIITCMRNLICEDFIALYRMVCILISVKEESDGQS